MTDQKHYPMPELSEQEREALSSLARIEITRWTRAAEAVPEKKYMVKLMQIALAALTAPKAEPTYYEAKVNGLWGSVTKSHYDDCKKFGVPTRLLFSGGEEYNQTLPIYTVPPVLADLLPDLHAIPDGHDLTSCMAGAAWYEQQLKRRLTLIESGKWKIVPVEPTPEMMLHNSGCHHHAWDDADCSMRKTRRLIWGHMLSAAPEAPC